MFGKKKKDEAQTPVSAIETQAKIAGFMKKAGKFTAEIDAKKDELLTKAKKAKLNNDHTGFKIACSGLATFISLKNRVEKMASTMDILSTLKDVSEMAGGFMSGIESVCKDISANVKGLNFAKMGKVFDSTMGGLSNMFEGLDGFVNDMSLGFDSLDSTVDPDLARQISDMIDKEEISKEEDNLDKVIEEKLKKLKASGGGS